MAKKDFSGKNKTSKTYDADWVFHNGAWVTKRQRRSSIAGQKEAKAYNQAINAPPVPTAPGTEQPPTTGTPPVTVPILEGIKYQEGHVPTPEIRLGGGPKVPRENVPTAPIPDWWINQAIQNPTDPNAQFANVANALLPTLAPEDQRTLANYLATNYKDVYGGYANTNFGLSPTEITADIRKQYLSPQRAQMALSLLEKMKTASGAQNMGAGYDFLKNAVGLINQFMSPTGVMGRENYDQFSNAVSSLIGQASGNKDLAAYSNLAQLFNLPKFSAGPLVGNAPNRKLFS